MGNHRIGVLPWREQRVSEIPGERPDMFIQGIINERTSLFLFVAYGKESPDFIFQKV
jgi:hypothetical protein